MLFGINWQETIHLLELSGPVLVFIYPYYLMDARLPTKMPHALNNVCSIVCAPHA